MEREEKTIRKVAIIGCGRMGCVRATACQKLGLDIALLFDIERGKLLALKEQFPLAQVYSNIAQISWKNIDAVFLCTPPSVRLDVLNSLAGIQVPIFMEKPFACNLDQAKKIYALLTKYKMNVTVGYMNRLRPSVQKLRKDLLQEEFIGFSAYWVNKRYSVPWWDKQEESGGQINEQLTHYIDLVRYLFGEVEKVSCLTEIGKNDITNGAAISLILQNGRVATLYYSCASQEKNINFACFCTNTLFELDGWDMDLKINEKSSVSGRPNCEDKNSIFLTETAVFLSGKSNDLAAESCDYRDAFRNQILIDAINRSIKTNRVELLENMDLQPQELG